MICIKKFAKFDLQGNNDSDYNNAIFTSTIIFLLWLGGITHMKLKTK